MTFVSTQPEQSFYQGLLKFLNSDNTKALAEGLLTSNGPEYMSGAIGRGLLHARNVKDIDRQRKIAEGHLSNETKETNAKVSKAEQEAEAKRAANKRWADLSNIANGMMKPPEQQQPNNQQMPPPMAAQQPGNYLPPNTGILGIGQSGQQIPQQAQQNIPETIGQKPNPIEIKVPQPEPQILPQDLGAPQNPPNYPGVINSAPPIAQPPMAPPPITAPNKPAMTFPGRGPQNDLVDIGGGLMVPRENVKRALAVKALTGDDELANKELFNTGGLSDIEKRAAAAGLIPGTPEYQQFIKDATLGTNSELTNLQKDAKAIFGDINSKEAKDWMKSIKEKGGININMGDEATKAIVTAQQKVIIGVDTAMPSIDELIKLAEENKVPYQGLGINHLSPNEQANYNAISDQVVEPLLGSFALSSTDHNAKVVSSQIKRQPYETKDAYISRLKKLKADLKARRKYASEITGFKDKLDAEKVSGERDIKDYTDAELEEIVYGKK